MDISQIKQLYIGGNEIADLYFGGKKAWSKASDRYWGFTLTARQANSTVKMVKVGSPPTVSLEYSTDGGTNWSTFTVGTTTVTLPNVGDMVCFKATTTN